MEYAIDVFEIILAMGKSKEHTQPSIHASLLIVGFIPLLRDVPNPTEADFQEMADILEADPPQVLGLSDEGLNNLVSLLRGEEIKP